ncbi:MAG: SUMF1/EgtB/PvdO family nonheme iron enzyme [Planctomycetes bacterium]|nr:SUMF1/EgtB/PvdO family nonheme iron enzyme [Planctomycetota bacterium]
MNTADSENRDGAHDPIAQAIEIHHRFLRGEGPQDPAALLAAHPGLRDLLEPLLADDDDGDEWPGTDESGEARLGEYRIVGELGRGGMGVVYEAEELALGRRVALKVLPESARLDPKALARFRRGSQLAASLDHPGINKVLAVGHDGDRDFFTMELVRGRTLAAVIAAARGTAPNVAKLPFPHADLLGFAIDIGIQVGNALHHAHLAGVVHRDVKPDNILVRDDGTAVLTDFGIARANDDFALTLTGEGDFAGTVAYAAPEQQRGDRTNVDHRADVWSLGATLYELLTLTRPFAADTYSEVRLLIDRVDPRAPSRRNPRVPRDLDAVVLHALEKAPQRRYQSAGELVADLERVRDGRPVPVRPIGPTARAARWCRRNPIAATLLCTIALSFVVVSIVGEVAHANATESAARLLQFRCVKIGRDVSILRNAIDRAPGPLPAAVPTLRTTLAMADELVQQLPELRGVLAELRRNGRPGERPTATRLLTGHPARERLEWLRRSRDAMAFRLEQLVAEGGARPQWHDYVRARLATMDREIDDLTARIAARRGFAFTNPEDEYLHDVVEDQIAQLEWLESRNLPELRARLAAAEAADAALARDVALWEQARADLAASGRYGDLELAPQPGLVPLGPDPNTGLLEFWHPRSGTRPDRDERGRLRIAAATGLVFVLLPAGTARIGERDRSQARRDELPLATVELEPFLIAKFELTHAQWNRLAAGLEARHDYALAEAREGFETKPIVRVRWFDCDLLCRANGLALPTEAQWEYACRAGTDAPWWCGTDPSLLPRRENVRDPAAGQYRGRIAVDTMTPNPFGLIAMLGNVQEWCADEYVQQGGEIAPGTGLRTGSIDGQTRAFRGGSYMSDPAACRASKRDAANPALDLNTLGLRPAVRLVKKP